MSKIHDKNAKAGFAAKFSELEEIVAYFEAENQDIDKALVQFERGVALSKELKQYLETAKNKVEKIQTDFEANT